ncbi:MAG: phosphatidate cytidylyltransferase [Pseudomonadota bacterium]
MREAQPSATKPQRFSENGEHDNTKKHGNHVDPAVTQATPQSPNYFAETAPDRLRQTVSPNAEANVESRSDNDFFSRSKSNGEPRQFSASSRSHQDQSHHDLLQGLDPVIVDRQNASLKEQFTEDCALPPARESRQVNAGENDLHLSDAPSGLDLYNPTDGFFLRIISSVLLGGLAIYAAYVGGIIFAVLTAILAVAIVFEWTRMVSGGSLGVHFYLLAGFAVTSIAAAAASLYAAAFCVACAGGLFAGVSVFLARNQLNSEAITIDPSDEGETGAMHPESTGGHGSISKAVWTSAGALYFLAPAISLLWLRQEFPDGRGLIFLLFAAVWSADTAAYLGGKLIGGPRLSPILSPGKTWAGAICGVLGSSLLGLMAATEFFGPVRFAIGNIELASSVSYAIVGAALGLASIVGDIVESGFKRFFGVKDISGFIPGHGGVLDRLDGMIFSIIAMSIVLYAQTVLAL